MPGLHYHWLSPAALWEGELPGRKLSRILSLSLRNKLEGMLQSKLEQAGDKLHPKQHYLKEWGYTVDARGNIPYFFLHHKNRKKPNVVKVQSPANKPK
jgi:hypothetical protein